MEAIYLYHFLVFHFFINAIHFSEAITWWYCIFVCVCVTILPANSKMQSDWDSTWCLSLTILNNEIEGHVFNLSELGSKNISLNSLQYLLFVEQRGKNRMSFASIFKLYFLLSFSCKSIFVKKKYLMDYLCLFSINNNNWKLADVSIKANKINLNDRSNK